MTPRRGSRYKRKTRKSATRKSGIRKHVPSPGPKVCSPLAATRRHGKGCLPTNVKVSLRQKGARPDCNTERCLVESSALTSVEKNKLLSTYFRPKLPEPWKEKFDTWLNNEDIEKVMKQYEEAYPHFKFIGVVPIDFSAQDPYVKTGGKKCISETFCHVDLKAEKAKGKTLLGAVFNLDPHYKGGSHWVALAVDLIKNKACYFDSYGMQPPEQVARFMRYLTLQNPNLALQSNGRRFQFSDTECGMYSLYFLIRMIQGEDFKNYCKHAIPDKYMYEFRKVLFDASCIE